MVFNRFIIFQEIITAMEEKLHGRIQSKLWKEAPAQLRRTQMKGTTGSAAQGQENILLDFNQLYL